MSMRNLYFILFFLGSLIFNSSYAQSFDWAVSCGGSEGDIAKSIGTDAVGNIYIAGYFRGTSDFDPGPGTLNLTSGAGNDDFFIQKLDANGNLIWVKTWGSSSDIDVLEDLTIDPMGNVYTTGYFQGTVDFDPGAGTNNLTSVGNRDIFVSKIDASGNFVWAKNIGGSSSDYGNGITADALGNVYVTGSFISSTMDVDPGPGTTTLNSNGTRDVFVLKLDANGNFVWGTSFGGSSLDQGHDIGLDNNGNVYTTGYYNGTVDFDPGIGTANITAEGSSDIFIHKLDPSGNFVWAKSFGGSSNDEGNAIAVDPSGNIYSTGFYRGTVDFDPNAGTHTITSAGSDDIFIQKLDQQGNFQWAHSFGNFSSDKGKGITLDQTGNIYTTGYFRHTVDFDPGTGTANGISNAGDDIFIQKLDGNGNFVWVQIFGSNANDEPNSINIGPNSTVLSCGKFPGTGDFDPTSGIDSLSSSGSNDIYVQKLSQCSPNSGTDIITACDSYTWIDNNTYTSSTNTPTHTLTGGAANGCDSIVTLNLTINNATNGTDVITACDTYTWIDNNTYTSSTNIPTHTITNGAANGCDSIVSLNLTINNATNGTDVITACDTYTWIDNNTYTSSTNTPTHTITNGAANGCDSIVTLNLTINTVDNTTNTQGNDSISANATGATYQWLDCDNNYAVIGGATNQLFVAAANGNYAVQVTANGCIDTSACVQVTGVGIGEMSNDDLVKVYPSPTSGDLEINLSRLIESGRLAIRSIDGKLVYQDNFYGGEIKKLVLNGNAGIYILSIELDSGKINHYKIIKN